MIKMVDEKKIGDSVDKKIRVMRKSVLKGPNIHALFPVVTAHVDLGDWVKTYTNENFAKKLVRLLPDLKGHTCSTGCEGDFIEKVEEGTCPAHIIEHVAIAIQDNVGSNVSFSRSKRIDEDLYEIIISYEYPALASLALDGSIKVVNKLLSGEENLGDLIENILENANEVYLKEKIGPSTKAILDAAKERDITYKISGDEYSLF